MHHPDPHHHSRRAFLRRSGALAVAGSAAPFALSLAAMGEAAAFDASDYKALVCIFLAGGNDHNNTVVPYDTTNHGKYATIRGAGSGGASIVLDRASLGNTVLKPTAALAEGRQFALHPAMGGLATLFDQGRLAVQLNVGPLVVPLTRQQYQSGNNVQFPPPPKLFSHNDQQSVWQSSSPEGSTVGWGGTLGDLALQSNSQAQFTCISLSGNSVFLAGRSALQYQCSNVGPIKIEALKGDSNGNQFLYDPAMREAFSQLIQADSGHVLEREYNRVTRRSIVAEGKVSSALQGVPAPDFPGGGIGAQLRTVARLIGGRNALGVKRQVFLVQLGGFDTHDGQVGRQPTLLKNLSDALAMFQTSMTALGVADKVTAFTASDFGRTLTSNGDGTDHGWGSHHFVVGGAVKGKAFYGTPPPISVGTSASPDDQWHVGQGRLLPSTSVDQYAATLARWFGVADSELAGILPNLRNFGAGNGSIAYPTNLGFMG